MNKIFIFFRLFGTLPIFVRGCDHVLTFFNVNNKSKGRDKKQKNAKKEEKTKNKQESSKKEKQNSEKCDNSVTQQTQSTSIQKGSASDTNTNQEPAQLFGLVAKSGKNSLSFIDIFSEDFLSMLPLCVFDISLIPTRKELVLELFCFPVSECLFLAQHVCQLS